MQHYKLPWLNWATVAMVIDTTIWAAVYFIKLNWNWMIELSPFVGLLPAQVFALMGLAGGFFLFTLWVNWVAWDRYSHRKVTASVHYGGGSRSIGSGYSPGCFYFKWDEEDLSGEE